MKMDNRAEGSFAETMMAMMVATVALTAFMGVFAYSLHAEHDSGEISTAFLDSVRIGEEGFTGIDESYIEEECVRMGYSSMVITLETAGSINHAYLRLGSPSDSDYTYEKGAFPAECFDGTVVMVNYEVVAFA